MTIFRYDDLYSDLNQRRNPAENHSNLDGSLIYVEQINCNRSLPILAVSNAQELASEGMRAEDALYSSASEVIRDALRLFEAYQSGRVVSLASHKGDIAQGVADIAASRVRELDMDEIKHSSRVKLAARQPGYG